MHEYNHKDIKPSTTNKGNCIDRRYQCNKDKQVEDTVKLDNYLKKQMN